MCTLAFQGMGYSKDFVENYKSIAIQLRKDPHTKIKVSFALDSICSACPHQTPENQCQNQEKIAALDMRHAKVLHLKEGDVLSWEEGLVRIKQYMALEKFHNACRGCSWKDAGMCERALSTHLGNEH